MPWRSLSASSLNRRSQRLGIISSSEPIFNSPVLHGHLKSVLISSELNSWFSLPFSGSKALKVHSFHLLTIMCFCYALIHEDVHLVFDHDCVLNVHICIFSFVAMCLEEEGIPKVWSKLIELSGLEICSTQDYVKLSYSLTRFSVWYVFLLPEGKFLETRDLFKFYLLLNH